jgi:hypothetical protein
MERQKRFFSREPRPLLLSLIDEFALRRDAGPGVMAAQVRHLIDAARWPQVTLQLVPPTLHAGLICSMAFANGAALVEAPGGGHVHQDQQTITGLEQRFSTIRAEALPRSQTMRKLEEMAHELA